MTSAFLRRTIAGKKLAFFSVGLAASDRLREAVAEAFPEMGRA